MKKERNTDANADIARKPWPSADWPQRFLAAFRRTGNVSHAARLARVDRTAVYARRRADADFAALLADAREEGTDALEAEARRRAVTGTPRPVFYKGEEVGQVREYSDTLLIVLLKAEPPKKYRAGGPSNFETQVDLSEFDNAKLERLAAGEALARVSADARRRVHHGSAGGEVDAN